jgi:hypothetical protein
LEQGKLQIGLYMLALRHVLGLEPVGGFYQPLGSDDARPRGAIRAGADPSLRVVKSDRLAEEELEALLGVRVDLRTPGDLPEAVRPRVIAGAKPV